MPTTLDEAAKILEISNKYLSPYKAKQLFTELDLEVGRYTNNDSLKQSLAMMRVLVSNIQEKERTPNDSWYMKTAFYIVVASHFAIIAGMFSSFFVLPFMASWYIALPLMVFIQYFCTAPVDCNVTKLENVIRQKLEMKRINGFVSYYVVKPIKARFR